MAASWYLYGRVVVWCGKGGREDGMGREGGSVVREGRVGRVV